MQINRLFKWISRLGVLALCFLGIFAVSEGAVLVDEAMISQAVIQHVKDVAKDIGMTKNGELLNIEVMAVPRAPFKFSETEEVSDITLTTSSSLDRFFSNRALVQVNISSKASGRARQIGVPVKVSLSKKVWVAKNTIMPRESLSARNVELVSREITTNFEQAAGEEIELSKYSTRMMLKKGQMLTTYQITKPPAVQRNTVVKIIMAGANGLKIMLDGKAMEDGQVGQLIRVRNRFNKNKFYRGRVVSENRVQVGI